MNKSKTIYLIGCGVLGPDIRHVAGQLNLSLKEKFLPGGLHDRPDVLHQKLQHSIDEAGCDDSCSRIIVGYGLCGKGTVGIKAPDVPLVFPKVHDCIALFLGSDKAYREEFKKYPGTFYISAGWSLEKDMGNQAGKDQIWLGTEAMGCEQIREKYGEKKGKDIISFFSSWQKNYQRAAFIDTGIKTGGQHAESAEKMAQKYNWKFQNIKGDLSLMTRLLTSTKTDDQILVVPPGYVTIYSATKDGLDAVPANEKNTLNAKPRNFVINEGKTNSVTIQYGLGIDAGGTYTDAVIYDFKHKVLTGKNKALTTKWDFSIGIDQAISDFDEKILDKVELVSVSTTLATNAIVEGEGQNPGLIYMAGNPGAVDELITHTPSVQVGGHMGIDGREIQVVNPDEIRNAAEQMIKNHGVTSFAVSGIAGAVNPSHELEVKKILQQQTGMVVTCGHELSDMLNFVVRAQTAVLNARIIPRMIKFFNELDLILKKRAIKAQVMVVKGDGTLMSRAMANDRPVETILSGPAASVAGAKLLTGLKNAMVVDIGGTTTDTADLCEGMVDVCESGAFVGRFATHVKALNMRTTGLGGDSHIRWEKEDLVMGPRRVAPMVWAGDQFNKGMGKALNFIESRLKKNYRSAFSQTVIVAMKGVFPYKLSNEEKDLYGLLLERPHTPEELAEKMNLHSARQLSFKRMEESGLVQRCGLTPTDILHVNGSFKKWNSKVAIQMIHILSVVSQKDPKSILNFVLYKFEKDLAKELLKKQLSGDVNLDEEKETQLSKFFIERIISGQQDRYRISASLKHPVIGIGAPAHYFLPNAGKMLNAKVVIPKDADVANALGAITSNIMIKQKVYIRPDQNHYYIVEGIEGAKQFESIDNAEVWAVEQLKNKVLGMGRLAGTSQKTIEFEIRDHIVTAKDGTSLFLDRIILATLSGSPDQVVDNLQLS